MTSYPSALDNDRTIVRIDDNLSELGTVSINQLREAVFAIEKTIGTNPQGSKTTVNDRVSVFLNADGSPKLADLASFGVAVLPITNSQVATNADISESKLNLDYGTAYLNGSITTVSNSLIVTSTSLINLSLDLSDHVDGLSVRHTASVIDLDGGAYSLYNIDHTTLRSGVTVADALLEINNELIDHEAGINFKHNASDITVDSSEFLEIPLEATNVQLAFDYLDQRETESAGLDRATLSSNGICRTSRIDNFIGDGYGINVIPLTSVNVYLAVPDGTEPNDTVNNGDTIVKFIPTQEEIDSYSFDEKFAHVSVGDTIRITYPVSDGNDGYIYLSSDYKITSIDHNLSLPQWVVRINSYNLEYVTDGYAVARVDKSKVDSDTWGVFAVAGAYQDIFPNLGVQPYTDGIILGNPRGAVAVGLGFDPSKLNSTHYNLYLRLYLDNTFTNYVELPAIDVTGDAGASCGKYNIDRIVESTNRAFRASGYNYRFIAFNQKGEFGIMLADSYNGAAFSIINGTVSGDTIITFGLNNVIGDAVDGHDGLGLGISRAGFASPIHTSSYNSAQAASNLSTLVIQPVRSRHVVINGTRRDLVGTKNLLQGDGYWLGLVHYVSLVDTISQVVQFKIDLDLRAEGLKPGKTFVVQSVNTTDTSIIGFGRFIIGKVTYSAPCDLVPYTIIYAVNGVHADEVGGATGSTFTVDPGNPTYVKIYFSDDSVGFNETQIVNDPDDYHRYHEIFINNEGHSFGIERARMIKQAAGVSDNLLNTLQDNWRIREVSSKLTGYQTDSGVYRYFVRLLLRNYNSTTGEFDGYIGQPSGTVDLINPGPVTKCKKDTILRFYNNTYVNYIDIEYREDIASTVCTNEPRIVDIEIFPSVSNNDEYFCIAGVSHSGYRLLSITDLRQFGTVSENNFSDSAIQFIEAGERYLHANGVVRGFEYEGVGIGTNRATLSFTGGLALVNGSFIAIDSYEVTLPEIKSSSSDIVEYFICVTQTGQLKAVIKDIGEQFFIDGTSYFVETLTFREIVDNRKDLTIIAKATINWTAGFNLQSITDARRFIINQDLGSFTWCHCEETDGYQANFRTTDALRNWVNEYNVKQVKVVFVKVQDSAIYLDFNNLVELIGGAYYINNLDTGICITNGNCKIKNANVYYKSASVYGSYNLFGLQDNTGANSPNGAIVFRNYSELDFSNISVEDCNFYTLADQTTPRPPFVSCFGTSNLLKNIVFDGNSFYDSTLVAKKGLAYAIVNISNAGSSDITDVSDLLVENTKTDGYQGLLISGYATSSGTSWTNPLFCSLSNCVIQNNKLGIIGFNVKSSLLTNQIKILNNITEMIISGMFATLNTSNHAYANELSVYSSLFGSECIVKGNSTSFIKIISHNYHSIISNNIVYIKSDSGLFNEIIKNPILGNRYAITIINNHTNGNFICSNNIIVGNIDSDLHYSYAIYIIGNGTISDNQCSQLTNGINVITNSSSINLISGNTLKSQIPALITPLINVSGSGYGFVSGNWFNILDRANIISGTISNWIVSSENFGTFDFPPP